MLCSSRSHTTGVRRTLTFAKDTTTFFSDRGLVTVATLEKVVTRDWHSILAWIRNPLGVKVVLAALFVTGTCFTVGLYTRVSAIVLFILVTSFHERNGLVLNSGDAVLRTMLFFFMFAPSGAAFSVDRLRNQKWHGDSPLPDVQILPWAQRMMQIQVALIYLTTAIQKTRGDLYRNGSAMYYVFGLVDFNVHGIEQLTNYPGLYKTLTFGMLGIEFALPCLLWFKASRPYAIAMGVTLHLWIMWCMTMPVFGILMIATYICFLSEAELDGVIAWCRLRQEKAKSVQPVS
jgi:hypothetical protein